MARSKFKLGGDRTNGSLPQHSKLKEYGMNNEELNNNPWIDQAGDVADEHAQKASVGQSYADAVKNSSAEDMKNWIKTRKDESASPEERASAQASINAAYKGSSESANKGSSESEKPKKLDTKPSKKVVPPKDPFADYSISMRKHGIKGSDVTAYRTGLKKFQKENKGATRAQYSKSAEGAPLADKLYGFAKNPEGADDWQRP